MTKSGNYEMTSLQSYTSTCTNYPQMQNTYLLNNKLFAALIYSTYLLTKNNYLLPSYHHFLLLMTLLPAVTLPPFSITSSIYSFYLETTSKYILNKHVTFSI